MDRTKQYIHGNDTLEVQWNHTQRRMYLNGQQVYEDNFKDGKEHGVQKGWDRNGRPIFEEIWENGRISATIS